MSTSSKGGVSQVGVGAKSKVQLESQHPPEAQVQPNKSVDVTYLETTLARPAEHEAVTGMDQPTKTMTWEAVEEWRQQRQRCSGQEYTRPPGPQPCHNPNKIKP